MRKAAFPVSRRTFTFGLVLAISLLGLLVPVAAHADGCVPSGTLFSCSATVSNVQITVTCPGAGTRTGKVGSVTATIAGATAVQAQADAVGAAQREAERVARERAFAACSSGPVTPAGGATSNIASLTNGPCHIEFGLFGCEATASGITATARCDGNAKKATGRLGAMTATSFASTIPQAQADARGIASAQGIRVATERALTKSCGRPVVLPGGSPVGAVATTVPAAPSSVTQAGGRPGVFIPRTG